MVKKINHNIMFLKKKSIQVKKTDKDIPQLIKDMKDTLAFNRAACVGMAANMIGVNKAVIIFSEGPFDRIMINPKITEKNDEYETEEGCLSLEGVRVTKRYKEITVLYQDENFEEKTEKFTGWVAQIIQHECDHLYGIII